ncbi:MAG: FAD-binding oxidoreductase, partial [Pseudomonadota bacterium]
QAEKLILELEDMTVAAKGRIYLAKDALARPDSIKAMYPEHAAWLKAVNKADPNGAYATDIVRRLNLRGEVA